MLTTTLNDILRHNPCGQDTAGETGFSKLLAHLGKTAADDEQMPLSTVLDSNGFLDALWCVRVIDSKEKKYSARLALSFAEDVRHLMADPRSTEALDVTRQYLDGEVPVTELGKADAARAVAYAADAAADAADAVRAAAYAYAYAAYAADAYAYAYAAADAVRDKQTTRLRRFFDTGEITP